jgi:bifunctional polynucleotide phosphatase/kinase
MKWTGVGSTDAQGMQMNPEERMMLPKLAFTGFAARYREPTLEEGFVDITTVDFKVRLITNAPRKY